MSTPASSTSGVSTAVTPAAVSSLSVERGQLDEKQVQQLATILKCSPATVILTAINLLHYRYTGIAECDIKLRISPASDTTPSTASSLTTPSSSAGGSGSLSVSSVMKNSLNFEQAVKEVEESVQTAKKTTPETTVDFSTQTFYLEFFQVISAELSSSGFQHLLHITVQASGSGKKRKINVRYEFPPMLTPGQADPRLRCAQHLPGIISGMIALSQKGNLLTTPIHELQFLGHEERKSLMREWSGLNQYDLVDRSDQLLQELFEETARKFPDHFAIECAAPYFRHMTYKQMSRRTNQLARWMRNNGVGVGKYVGMWLPRGMEMYIGLIAILKAGAAYVPCDSEYPSDRVNFILDDCKAPVLITHSELVNSHPDFVLPDGCKMIQYDQVDSLLDEQDDTFPTREQTGQTNQDVCYVIYTSGSTGRPKGCQLEHRSAVNLVRAERILFGVHENDRVYQGFSIAFDASVEEVWLAFASGATLVSATPDMLHAGPGLPAMLVEQKITIISTVPTLLSMMEDTIPDVRILISGGEAVQKDLIKRWSKGRRFINTYGPTEATVIATHIDTDPTAPLVTIGRAVPSYFLYILDQNLNPCPIGVGGELHIGGICVARGYLQRDELTKEKFIPYPKHKLWYESETEDELDRMVERSPRLYKAGDLCRWTENGEIEFCGRIDAQVKLRGYRVELSEIESVLMTQDNIQSAVVSVREDVPGIQNLIGYVILKNPSIEFNQDVIKEGIRVRLPPYMIPACIDVLTKFPTLPSGKVNRKELPPPKNLVVINYDEDPDEAAESKEEVVPKNLDAAGATSSSLPAVEVDPNYFPPRSPLEKKLAQMWRKLFQRQRISSTDDFFTLGGHSLLAAWLVSALRKDAQTEHVTMADVYGYPKLRELAWRLLGNDPNDLVTPEEEAAAVAAAHAANVAAGGPVVEESKESKEEEEAAAANDSGLQDENGVNIQLTNGTNANGDSMSHALENFAPISNTRFILCGFFQLLSLYFLYALPALQIGIPWEFYLKIRSDGWIYIIIMLLPFVIAIFPVYVFFAIVAKWILIGKYKEGKHQLWGFYYFRWWLVQRLIYYIPLIYLRGSPILNIYFRLMGGRIGRNVFLNTHLIEAPDLVQIGEDSSIGIDAQIINFHVENNWLYIRKVVIGKCCYVGARSVVSGGSSMCDHSQLGAMSLLTQGTRIPPWQHWRGSPAVMTARVENYMPRAIVQAGANVATKGNFYNGVNGKAKTEKKKKKPKYPVRPRNGGLNDYSDEPSHAPSSLLTRAQQDSLYNDDDAEDEILRYTDDASVLSTSSSASSASDTSKFLTSNLSEHLLSSNPTDEHFHDGSIYIGVGDESIAWRSVRPSESQRFLLGLGQTCVLTLLLPCMVLISLFPGMLLLHQLMPSDVNIGNFHREGSATWKYLAAAAPMAFTFTILLSWQITIVKWVLIGQIQPGDYKIHSWFYLRKWTVDTLMQLSIQVLHPIYSTVFLVPWFRSLGAIVGERCEIATAVYAAPDLIEIGDETFIADTVYLGVPAVHMGTIRLAKITLGSRVFVGNGACLPMQTVIGNGCLVGVMSAPPLAHPLGDATAVMHWPEPALKSDNGTAWLGNPAMYLPNRQPPSGKFDDSTTYHPSIFLQTCRFFFELIKLTLPLFLFIVSMLFLMGDFQLIRVRFSQAWQFWLIWPLLYMGAGVACCLIVLLIKWLVIGKYIAGEHPLWSSFIWRHDLVTSLLDSLIHPYFINLLRGTPFVSMWFRLLGAEIGARVWLDTTQITEPDLVHIGDDVALHNDSQIQTHLFEDRILKMSHLNIEHKCSSQCAHEEATSDTSSTTSTRLDISSSCLLSLVCCGESLPAWTYWQGVPSHQTHSIGDEAPLHMDSITSQELANGN